MLVYIPSNTIAEPEHYLRDKINFYRKSDIDRDTSFSLIDNTYMYIALQQALTMLMSTRIKIYRNKLGCYVDMHTKHIKQMIHHASNNKTIILRN